MKYNIVSNDMYQTSKWSGGLTTQIAIYPEDANVAKQDFIYRISSATVNLDSTFTNYNDYIRYIATLDNEIILNENKLSPLEVHKFLGSDHTTSKGVCTDFNLICNKDYNSNMEIITKNSNIEYKDFNHYIFYASEDCTINVNDTPINVPKGNSLLVYDNDINVEYTLNKGHIIACMINI